MSGSEVGVTVPVRGSIVARARRLARADDGATAIEFAVVAMPFLMLVFGIIAVGLFHFTWFSMDHAVEQASRMIRTGAYRAANSNTGMSTQEFKNQVCALAPQYVDCSKVRVHVTVIAEENTTNAASTGFSGAGARPSCTQSNGNLINENSNATRLNVGASAIVLVTSCYQFDLMGKIPFLSLGRMTGSSSDGAALMLSAATFRTEPWE